LADTELDSVDDPDDIREVKKKKKRAKKRTEQKVKTRLLDSEKSEDR
jgi:hypothetical protein